MKKRLSVCIALALGLTSLQTSGGELTISPSLTMKGFQVDIDSESEQRQRDEVVLAYEFVTTADYESNVYNSSLEVEWINYHYTESDDIELNNVNLDWANNWSFMDDRVGIYADYTREYDFITAFQGSFDSWLFGYENNVVLYRKSAGVAYTIPQSKDIDGVAKIDYSDSNSSGRGQSLIGSDEQALRIVAVDSGNLRGYMKVGQYEDDPDMLWYLDVTRDEFYRNDESVYQSLESSAKGRIPVVSNLYLVGTGYLGENESTFLRESGLDGQTQDLKTTGAGLAWKRGDQLYIEVTHEWDHSNETTFWAGTANWQISKNWSLQWDKRKRVFGDVESATISYSNERHTLTATHSEMLDIRRQNRQVLVGDSVYICEIGESGEPEFTEDLCFVPVDQDYTLGEGQFTYTSQRFAFPIVERLVFVKESVLQWHYDNLSQWRHRLDVEWRDEESLEEETTDPFGIPSGLGQEALEIDIEGEWLLDDVRSIKPSFRIADTDRIGLGRTIERLTSVVYEQELNRNSEFSVGVQYTNLDSFQKQLEIDGYSVFATYTYHFGKNNKRRRGLYPGR